MKAAAFAYLAPSSIEEAVAQLAEHGPEARVLAGGQSLVRLMNTRVSTPSVIIDINRIPELGAISISDGAVHIGAIVRQRSCEIDPQVAAHVPLFTEAGSHVAHVSVRQRGTVVGSVAFADPSAELPAALLALDGQVVVRSSAGERLVDADDRAGAPRDAVALHRVWRSRGPARVVAWSPRRRSRARSATPSSRSACGSTSCP